VVKHVNAIELGGDVGNGKVCGWLRWGAIELVGGKGVSPSCCLFGRGKLMQRQQWARHENRGRERQKEKEGRGVKGIYCQEPSISGNRYACIGLKQTCCFSSSTTEVKKQQRSN